LSLSKLNSSYQITADIYLFQNVAAAADDDNSDNQEDNKDGGNEVTDAPSITRI